MPLPREYELQRCALARAMEVVGERWTLLILRDLFFGVRRFGELHTRLDIPKAVLSARLNTLVEHGVVERRPYRPGRDEFVLTDRGLELWPALHGLMQWGERHLVQDGPVRTFNHVTCGTELEPYGYCAACGTEPPPADVETRPGRAAPRREDPVSRALRSPRLLLTPFAT